jgi:peptidoglycan/xylan/chitin deacetylase (PgdA/CDA1 family)
VNRVGLKRLLGRLWAVAPSFGPRRIILLYHAIGSGRWATSERDFSCQMNFVATQATPLSLVQALGTKVDKDLEIAVTFDDGYATVKDRALPIMNALGLTATVFLNTSFIGTVGRTASDPAAGHYPDQEFMSWQDVDELLERGWIVGSHGARHLDLVRQSDATVREELLTSKRDIERISAGAYLYFAYTNGRSSARVRRLVAESGYRWGLSTIHGDVRADGEAFAVPRINIDARYSMDDFQAILKGDWDYLRFVQTWRGVA